MRWRRRVRFLSKISYGETLIAIQGTIFVQDKLRRNPFKVLDFVCRPVYSIRKYHKDMKNLEEIDKRYKDLSRRKVEKRVPNFLELETQKEKEPL
ncbi:hypothetical protein C5167_023099 [Papaver somniferum]|uniref:Uncharacterized protein n=1 Tax=Papaver somniferum TaxID=3469 RepID=A0A4Y7JJV2_PAPSO|nr:hypothetical protein C5167_023099 [Papaver somniferum]